MDVQATRLNWYRDSSEWKPFHHDAAALKPDKVYNILVFALYKILAPILHSPSILFICYINALFFYI